MLCYYHVKFVVMEINYLKLSKLLVTGCVAHSNVSYRGPCIDICIVSLENVSLQPKK